LADLESTLRSIFTIQAKTRALPTPKIIPVPGVEKDLRMAAEFDEPPKLAKRENGNGGA
jgi:hypothetical protein